MQIVDWLNRRYLDEGFSYNNIKIKNFWRSQIWISNMRKNAAIPSLGRSLVLAQHAERENDLVNAAKYFSYAAEAARLRNLPNILMGAKLGQIQALLSRNDIAGTAGLYQNLFGLLERMDAALPAKDLLTLEREFQSWQEATRITLSSELLAEVLSAAINWLRRTTYTGWQAKLLLERGNIWQELNRPETALEDFLIALNIIRPCWLAGEEPWEPYYLEAPARLLIAQKEWEAVKPLLLEISESRAAPGRLKSWAWGQLANIFFDSKQLDEAEKASLAALDITELDPDEAVELLLLRGEIFLVKGQEALAGPERKRRGQIRTAYQQILASQSRAEGLVQESDSRFVDLNRRADNLVKELKSLEEITLVQGKAPGAAWKIFISSTIEDLDQYRKTLQEALYDITFIGSVDLSMERMGSLSRTPVRASLDRVQACDLMIILFGVRYGKPPEGSSKSITEQEFDCAESSMKRCLCYFADPEASFPAGSGEEEPTQKEALKNFAERVKKKLVSIKNFKNPEDLAKLVTSDLVNILSGDPLGFYRDDFVNRCQKAAYLEATLLEKALRGVEAGFDIPTSIEKAWAAFTEQKVWEQRLHFCGNILMTKVERLAEQMKKSGRECPDWLANSLEALKGLEDEYERKNYIDLARALVSVNSETVQSGLEGLYQIYREMKKADDAAGLQLIEEVQARFAHLISQVKAPSYQRCFLLRGEPGSGKTQFLFHLLDRVEQHTTWIPILLHPPEVPYRLADYLIQSAQYASGYGWRNLTELNWFLEQDGLKVVWIIDGLEKWLDADEKSLYKVKQYLERYSEKHAFYWIITVRDREGRIFPLAQPEEQDNRWEESVLDIFSDTDSQGGDFGKTYGFFTVDSRWMAALQPDLNTPENRKQWLAQLKSPPQSQEKGWAHVGGWISLNDLNLQDQIGLQAINRHLQDGLDLSQVEPGTYRHMNNPFIAWILHDLLQEGVISRTSFRNLSYIEFVEKFWVMKRKQYRDQFLEAFFTRLDLAVTWTADFYLEEQTGRVLRQGLLRYLQQTGQAKYFDLATDEKVHSVLTILEFEHLLETFKSADQEGKIIDLERLDFESFWHYRLADQVSREISKRGEDLESACRGVKELAVSALLSNPRMGAGVIEVLFLILAKDSQESILRGLVAYVMDSLPTWRTSLWFAGSKSNLTLQILLIDWAERHPTEVWSTEELFALLYFLRELPLEAASLTVRMKVLSACYKAIQEFGQVSPILDLIPHWYELSFSEEDKLESLVYLNGTEKLEMGETMGRFGFLMLLDLTWQNSAIQEVIFEVLQLVKRSQDLFRISRVSESWRRNLFIEWFLYHFCGWLVEMAGFEAYEWLDEAEYFDEMWKDYRILMEREATIALGYGHRKLFSSEERENYENTILQLLDQEDSNSRWRAFYLASHAASRRDSFRQIRETIQHDPLFIRRREDDRFQHLFEE